MIMITVTILALVLVYKSFCNTVCIYMVMQIKLVVVVSLSYSIAPFFWLPFCLTPVSLPLFSLLQSRPILLASFLSSPSFFAALLSLTVSPHSFGFLFVSPQFLCHSSLSYSIALFFWIPFCLAPVFFAAPPLQSRPVLLA